MNLATNLNAVVVALRAIPGIESADIDPALVTPPGVLVQLATIDKSTLTGRELGLNLLLVVGDTDTAAAATALSTLLTAVETFGQADGQIVARSVFLPSNATTPLPGLLFPLTVRTDT